MKEKKNHSSKNHRRKKKVKKNRTMFLLLWNLLFYISMLSILIGAGMMALMQQNDKSFNGYRIFGVLTDSMVSPDNSIKKGGFRSGDVLLTKEVDPAEIRVGDVITYRPSTNPANKSTNYLTHRVVKVSDQLGDEKGLFFTTRGDANKTDDMPISSTALIGKEMMVIPKIGGIILFVKENWLISIVFIVSLIGFIWVIRSYVFIPTKHETNPAQKNRSKRKKQPVLNQGNKGRTKKKKKKLDEKTPQKYKQEKHLNKDITSKEDNINKVKQNRRK